MCDTCGCNVTPGNAHLAHAANERGETAVSVLSNLLTANDQVASHNRAHFDEHGVLAINLMSSPGSGKTALIEATIDALKDELRIAVIEGDLETENDAARVRAKGVPPIRSRPARPATSTHMVHEALHHLALAGLDVLFIENVGNLVCPASFDLGQHRNITLLSVTEGDDKPSKYPVMFRAADLMLLTKTDLLSVIDDFDVGRAEANLRALANPAPVIRLSARKGAGIEQWIAWLKQEVRDQRQRVSSRVSLKPAIQPDGTKLHQSLGQIRIRA